jgi:hypothetical protein
MTSKGIDNAASIHSLVLKCGYTSMLAVLAKGGYVEHFTTFLLLLSRQ